MLDDLEPIAALNGFATVPSEKVIISPNIALGVHVVAIKSSFRCGGAAIRIVFVEPKPIAVAHIAMAEGGYEFGATESIANGVL
jgi:hypothetical protein